MKITGRTMIMSQYTTEETIKRLKSYGFDGMEFCFCDRHFEFRSDLTEEFFASHVVELSKKYDFPIYSTSYHCGFVFDDQCFENVKKAIRATPLYGVKTCITSNSPKRLYHDQEDWELLVSRAKELAAIAEEVGVDLAIEFEPGMVCGCTADLLRLREEVGSPALKANLDIGHVFLCDPDPLQAICDSKDMVVHGHVENMWRGVHRHLAPHHGDMDLNDYFKTIADIGFDGAMALDLYQDDFEDICADAVTYLKNLLKTL